MNNIPNILRKVILASLLTLPVSTFAQSEFSDLFKGAPADISKIANAYISPATTGLGIGLNSGWYSSARAKSALRFDLRITATVAEVPASEKTFDVSKLGLTSLEPVGTNMISSTIAGPDVSGARLRIKTPAVPNVTLPAPREFSLPNGLGVGYVPTPQAQLSIGLGSGLEVSGRYAPTINLDDYGKVNLFGVGAKIELLRLFGKAAGMLPIDIALAGGYTELKWNMPLSVGDFPNPNQKLDIVISGLSTDLVLSKKLAFFTPFVSAGYESTKSNVKATGEFVLEVPVTLENPTGKQTIIDPIDFERDKVNRNEIKGMKATVGFQLHLAIFRLYGSYTKSHYNYYNAGIGIGIGK